MNKKTKKLSSFAGVLSEKEADYLKRRVQESRKLSRQRMRRIIFSSQKGI